MRKNFYVLDSITNMHVGSGDLNYNIIDNQIQRDQITSLPTINGSSLKGALRHHFENNKNVNDYVKEIFGDEDLGKGKYRFFEANLLTMPVRSNIRSYFNATSISIIEELIRYFQNFKINEALMTDLKALLEVVQKTNLPCLVNCTSNEKVIVENYGVNSIEFTMTEDLVKLFDDELVIFDDTSFKRIAQKLPVLARNRLGENKNLWYEEIVPKKSKFYTLILNEEKKISDFENSLVEQVIQIGGNATIGYGYTRFNLIGDYDE